MVRVKYFCLHLIILLLLLLSCKSQNQIYIFDPMSTDGKEMNLSEISDDITYIPLDNTLPLGVIYKYEVVNNYIYLSTKDTGILVFDQTGKFIRRIGAIGRGPGEYAYSMFFEVDKESGTIYVLDSNGAIKVYSKIGRFLRTLHLNEYWESAENIDILNSILFVNYTLRFSETKYDWICLDTLGNLLKKKNNSIKSITSRWGESGGTYTFKNNMHFWNPFNDTVFSISPNLSYGVSFLLKPGEFRTPIYDVKSFEQFDKFLHIVKILETNDYILIRYNYEGRFLAMHCKKNNKTISMELEYKNANIGSEIYGGILNDFDGGTTFIPDYSFTKNDREFISAIISPMKIKSQISDSEFRILSPKCLEKKRDFEKLANELKETDNPVLMIVRLKK